MKWNDRPAVVPYPSRVAAAGRRDGPAGARRLRYFLSLMTRLSLTVPAVNSSLPLASAAARESNEPSTTS